MAWVKPSQSWPGQGRGVAGNSGGAVGSSLPGDATGEAGSELAGLGANPSVMAQFGISRETKHVATGSASQRLLR